MIENTQRPQRPLIDRPRYGSKPPTVVNTERSNKPKRAPKRAIAPVDFGGKNTNKQRLNKSNRKVIDKQTQQPVSGSINKIDEAIKAVSPKPKKTKKMKNKVTPPIKPKVSEEEKSGGGGIFKQIKDKFVVNPKDK